MTKLLEGPTSNPKDLKPAPEARDAWVFPTSFAQRRLWFIDQLETDKTVYNVPGAFRIRGHLHPGILERSFAAVIARHEILRTTFRPVNGEPMQIVAVTADFHLPVIDLRSLPAVAREAEVMRIIQAEPERPFDLAEGPLLRAALLELGPSEQVLILSLHHIITDSWSHEVLMRELTSIYSALIKGEMPALPELPIQYADFAAWQRGAMKGEVLEKELGYWRERLKGVAPLDLPHRPGHAPADASEGATFTFDLPEHVTAAVRAMAQREGLTLFTAFLAAWEAFLARYTGQTDIAVGSPISNRSRTETEGLIGFFLNTLVLRTDLSDNPTVREALRRVRDAALEAFSHQDLPFEMIVEELRPARQPGKNPLVRVMFVLITGDEKAWRTTDAELDPVPIAETKAKFDLMLHLRDTGRAIRGALVYDKGSFNRVMVHRIAAHFETLLAGMAAHPDARINSLPLILPEERERILHAWNDTATPFPADRTIHALFREQAQLNPGAIAVEDGGRQVNYGELNRNSDAVAAMLVRAGVRPGDAVAISLPRSARLIAGILGILKAGATYVPLDASYPAARLDLMLQQSRARFLIGEGEPQTLATAAWLSIEPCLNTSAPPAPDIGLSSDIAYIMFTSGSTGVPKGVRVPHRAISRLVINTNYVQFTPADVVAYASNTSFDASTFEIWGALLHGARLVIVPKETLLAPRDFVAFIRDRKISVLFLTTPLFHHFAREIPGGFGTLRYLVVGGDALQPEAARAVLQSARPSHLVNGYGPTEATTFAVCHDVTQLPPDAVTVPIGRPISNTTAYILDAAMEPVPAGIAGELYLGGPGIADGYLNDPQATAASFIPDPFSIDPSNPRLYKTGDLARWRDDGVIEFLGRADNQVKIRGFRIEPGEIEATLHRHPGVRHAIVIPRPDSTGQKQLAAYIVPTSGAPLTAADLRDHLLSSLPEYMVPAAFAFLDTLPLNANGKVDLAALTTQPLTTATHSHEAPGTWLEASLAEIWETLLDHRPIGVTDDFFDLGGHSLLAIRMLAEVEKRTGIKIPPRLLFQGATIRHLTKAVQSPSPLVRVQPEGSKPPLFFFHGDFLFGGLYLANLARYLPRDRPCYAIEPHGFDGAEPPPTIEEMAASRLKTILEVQPEGPYSLGGFCNGGLVAFQVAQLLRAQGKEVACLVLLGANGMNSRYRLLNSLTSLLARIGRMDPGAARDLFLKWRARSLFAGLLFRHHLKELHGADGALHPMLIWAKIIGFAKWLLKMAGSRGQPIRSDPSTPPLIQNMENPERPIWNIYTKAVNCFVPAPYDGKVFLFRETELPPELTWMESDLGWGKITESLSIQNIPGGHFTITEHSNIKIFAAQLKVCLDQSEAERRP